MMICDTAGLGGQEGRQAPWTLEQIQEYKATATMCIVVIIDSTSGFEWERNFSKAKVRCIYMPAIDRSLSV